MSLENLIVGTTFGTTTVKVTAEEIGIFVEATQENVALYQDGKIIPPMLLAARGIEKILGQIHYLPGMIHVTQEMNFFSLCALDTPLTFTGEVVQNNIRGGKCFFAVSFVIANQNGNVVQEGKCTVIIPQ